MSEPKKIKCKKCHLTYNKKEYECPYCHTKRFNPTGLIIALIIIIVGCGAALYFKGDEIISAVSISTNKSKNIIDGIKFTPLEVENNDNELKITFEVENTNDFDVELDYELSAYTDGYLTDLSQRSNKDGWLIFDWNYNNLSEVITAKKKCKYNAYINVAEDWEEVEIYCRRTESNAFFKEKSDTIATSEDNQNILVMTIKNNEK